MNGTNRRRPIPQKGNVCLISVAHDYRTVIVGKTNFCRRPKPRTWERRRIGRLAGHQSNRGRDWVRRLDARSAQPLRSSPKSVAAARSTGLRPSTSATPKAFRGCQSCRFRHYNYKIVIISKIKFLIGTGECVSALFTFSWEK
jgi:hypothetical protein